MMELPMHVNHDYVSETIAVNYGCPSAEELAHVQPIKILHHLSANCLIAVNQLI